MPYNLVEAGKAIGMGKSSVLRAIRKGVISASRDPTTGGWAIEPAELHRAFLAVANGTADNRDGTAETDAMREVRARLADKDALITSLERTVEDLRRRLDTATEQLGEALTQVRLLTDQRQPGRRSWWRWR